MKRQQSLENNKVSIKNIEPPVWDQKELYGIVETNRKKPYDIREVSCKLKNYSLIFNYYTILWFI